MDVHDRDSTFITAGPSNCSDNDAAHHISVAAISLNAAEKFNIAALSITACSIYTVKCAQSHMLYIHTNSEVVLSLEGREKSLLPLC